MIYRKKWQKRWQSALLLYARDFLIQNLPIPLPRIIISCLFGFEPDFIFIVHARRKEDIVIALPFLRPIRKVLNKKIRYKVLQKLQPFVLGRVTTPSGKNGLIITTTKLPSTLMEDKKGALKELKRCLSFARKIAGKKIYVGLGGWWPMVTRRGLSVKEFAEKNDLIVTNGHTGTLCSVYLMIKRLSNIANVDLAHLDILVLGSGKMGKNVATALVGKVRSIYLYDLNMSRSLKTMNDLSASEGSMNTKISALGQDKASMISAMNQSHITVCTASNVSRILSNDEIPKNIIIIDDSRPEAFSRVQNKSFGRIILEGGLLKIMGARSDYQFGFGLNNNVFGCLAEAYLLASDQGQQLRPSLGNIEMDNYRSMLSSLGKHGVAVGDFKTSNISVSDSQIKSVFEIRLNRNNALQKVLC